MTQVLSVVRWEEPPPPMHQRPLVRRNAPRKDYTALRRQLREQPGRWALVGHDSAVQARRIAAAIAYVGGDDGSFESVTRQTERGVGVYARWVPGVSR